MGCPQWMALSGGGGGLFQAHFKYGCLPIGRFRGGPWYTLENPISF